MKFKELEKKDKIELFALARKHHYDYIKFCKTANTEQEKLDFLETKKNEYKDALQTKGVELDIVES